MPRSGRWLDRGRPCAHCGRPGDHRQMARQSGVHPPSHTAGDRGRQGGAAGQSSDTEAATPICRRRSSDDENRGGRQGEYAMLGVCTHLGCVPIGNDGDYTVVENNVKVGAGSARATARITTRRDGSERGRRRRTCTSRNTPISATPRSASDDRSRMMAEHAPTSSRIRSPGWNRACRS